MPRKGGQAMIIIGHSAIAYTPFVKISALQEIAHTHQSCIVWFDSAAIKPPLGFDIAAHCHNNQVPYAVMIRNLEELLLYAALSPQYLIIAKAAQSKAKAFQRVIDHYLLDCKLLCVVKLTTQLPKIAQLGIDGAIFKQVLDNIPSPYLHKSSNIERCPSG